jgi:hypothetical protein
MSPKIIWSLFTVGIIALGISIYQLNAALNVTEGRVPSPDYPIPTATTTTPPINNTSTPPADIPTEPVDTTMSVATVISQANQWNGKQVCVHGTYQNSFEFTALAQNTSAEGYLLKPYIWVGVPVDESRLNCKKNQVGQSTCTAETTLCGMFQAAAEGQPGYGHVSAYRYQLTSPTQPIKGNIPLQPN